MSRRTPCWRQFRWMLPAVVAAFAASAPSWVGAVRVVEISPQSHPYTVMQCARQPIEVRMVGSLLEVRMNGESRLLSQAVSASGARYVAPDDPETEFWGKGPLATLKWSGSTLPTCAEQGAMVTPFKVSGNEPFWAIEYDGWQLALTRPGVEPIAAPAHVTERGANGSVIQTDEGSVPSLRLTMAEGICHDSMSGMPRPYSATLQMEGERMEGCGGDTARLLQGTRWKLDSLNGQTLGAEAWLEFLPDARLTGHNGCNRLMGSYTLSGEGMQLGQLGSTRMACPAPAMAQASAIDHFLSAVSHFELPEADTLILRSSAGELIARSVSIAPK